MAVRARQLADTRQEQSARLECRRASVATIGSTGTGQAQLSTESVCATGMRSYARGNTPATMQMSFTRDAQSKTVVRNVSKPRQDESMNLLTISCHRGLTRRPSVAKVGKLSRSANALRKVLGLRPICASAWPMPHALLSCPERSHARCSRVLPNISSQNNSTRAAKSRRSRWRADSTSRPMRSDAMHLNCQAVE